MFIYKKTHASGGCGGFQKPKGHLDTQMYPECEGKPGDRDIVKKTREKRKKKQKKSFNLSDFMKEAKKTVKQRSRGTCVFQSTSPKVKDNKDHFPINNLAHGSNALARVEQYKSVSSWYKGTLDGLKSAVKKTVYKKFPGLKSRKEKKEDK